MTARKPRAAQTTVDAREFDLAGFLSGFKPAVVSAKLHRRGDLIPVLADIKTRYEQAVADEGRNGEKSITEADPVAALVAEWNQTQAEFEAGGFEEFQFRPMTEKVQKAAFTEHKEQDDGDPEWLTLRLMAATCVSHNFDAATFAALRDHVGDPAFTPLVKAFTDAYSGGGEPDASFLQPSSPTPGGDGLSSVSGPPANGDNPLS